MKDEDGLRDPFRTTALCVPKLKPMDCMEEQVHDEFLQMLTHNHINSISANSDHETYLSADDLRINLRLLEITNTSFKHSGHQTHERGGAGGVISWPSSTCAGELCSCTAVARGACGCATVLLGSVQPE